MRASWLVGLAACSGQSGTEKGGEPECEDSVAVVDRGEPVPPLRFAIGPVEDRMAGHFDGTLAIDGRTVPLSLDVGTDAPRAYRDCRQYRLGATLHLSAPEAGLDVGLEKVVHVVDPALVSFSVRVPAAPGDGGPWDPAMDDAVRPIRLYDLVLLESGWSGEIRWTDEQDREGTLGVWRAP